MSTPGTLYKMRGSAKYGPSRMFGKYLADGQWHARSEIQPKLTRMFPPEFFARLETCGSRTGLEARKNWWFLKALNYMVRTGYVERETGTTPKYQDFRIRLTEKGKTRFKHLSTNEITNL